MMPRAGPGPAGEGGKGPTSEDLDHDNLWRCLKRLSERGRIGIFNRSYYEEVLAVRVHPAFLEKQKLPPELVTENIWRERFQDIRCVERYLGRNGVLIRKFFLHVSKREQKRRFLERPGTPEKNWKFSANDTTEREFWDDYMEAYEEMIRHTATRDAPWYVVPADNKWFTRVGRLETTAAAEKTRVDQLTTQLGEVRGIATDARTRADAAASAAQFAGQRADAAMARANEGVNKADAVNSRLTQVLANRLKRSPVLQVDMFFQFGKSDLSAEAQTALQGVVKLLADKPTYTADVVGFTDGVGTRGYNVNLSWLREEAVRRFLVEKGAALNRFFFIGLGEDLATGKTAAGEAKDQRGAVQVYSPAD